MTERKSPRICRLLGCVCVSILVVTTSTHAQVITRGQLIESAVDALDNFEDDRARELFVAAVNPVGEPPDSIWAIGIQHLTQMYLAVGNADLADTWTRWAVRLVPDMQADEVNFPPQVINRYRAAVSLVGAGTPGDDLTETNWIWPSLGSRETTGAFRISPSTLDGPITANISGRGVVMSGEDLELPPGTYSMQVTADGYNSIDITREVLPGVTSVLTFNLEFTLKSSYR